GLPRCSRNHSGRRRKDERFSCQRRTMEGQSTDRRSRGAVSHPRIFLRVLITGSTGPGQEGPSGSPCLSQTRICPAAAIIVKMGADLLRPLVFPNRLACFPLLVGAGARGARSALVPRLRSASSRPI